ncbi:hypothetical protein LJC36_05805 [Desulfovibrio sp. OttesenSCG-928-C14]|nr:hypothetical protein [Desulfovibrio sp. OttesenSCG-928-C14]
MHILTCPKCGSQYERHPLNPQAQELCPACRNAASWNEIHRVLAEAAGREAVSPVSPVSPVSVVESGSDRAFAGAFVQTSEHEELETLEAGAPRPLRAASASPFFGRRAFASLRRAPAAGASSDAELESSGWEVVRFDSPLASAKAEPAATALSGAQAAPAESAQAPGAALLAEATESAPAAAPAPRAENDGLSAGLEAGAILAGLQSNLFGLAQAQPAAPETPVRLKDGNKGREEALGAAAPAPVAPASGSAALSAGGLGLALAVEPSRSEAAQPSGPGLFAFAMPPAQSKGAMIQAPDECG